MGHDAPLPAALSLRLARSTIACLPVALWRGRVIGTDCRLLLVLHVSSDNQEHEQGSGEDYPTIRAHQNKPCHGMAVRMAIRKVCLSSQESSLGACRGGHNRE